MSVDSLRDMLIRHEGIRLRPYTDSVGKLTIGVGRNLDDVGISHDEAMLMLDHDIERVTTYCLNVFPWMHGLSAERQLVVLNMAFNLGVTKLMGFSKMLTALAAGNYETAANEMLDSLWAKQVKGRAIELANLMRGPQEV